jgi:ATP-dependent HslUV protease, peptidase subunit HslV
MTTIVGIWDKVTRRSYLGFDNLVTTAHTRLGTCNKSAVLHVGEKYETCIAMAGPVTAILAVQSLAKDSELLWRTTLEVYESLNSIHNDLKTLHGLNVSEGGEDEPFESSQFQAVIGNCHGLWTALSQREVVQADWSAACGSGHEFALGALHALGSGIDPKVALQRALSAAACYDKDTGNEVTLWTGNS